jgi:hypothetical protein
MNFSRARARKLAQTGANWGKLAQAGANRNKGVPADDSLDARGPGNVARGATQWAAVVIHPIWMSPAIATTAAAAGARIIAALRAGRTPITSSTIFPPFTFLRAQKLNEVMYWIMWIWRISLPGWELRPRK